MQCKHGTSEPCELCAEEDAEHDRKMAIQARSDFAFEWVTSNTGPAGWYATVHCWEPHEGMFPGAHYWDGEKWDCADPIVAHAGPFTAEAEAKAWAEAHDPEA